MGASWKTIPGISPLDMNLIYDWVYLENGFVWVGVLERGYLPTWGYVFADWGLFDRGVSNIKYN